MILGIIGAMSEELEILLKDIFKKFKINKMLFTSVDLQCKS